jgi:signal transduction histidine kinase/DNA-binding response OmpR family regulator
VKSVRFLNSLVTQMLLFLVMLSVAISIASVTTQARISREGTRERYASQAEIAVRLAASFISAEDVDFYLETLEADDKYYRLLDTLRSIQTISGMTYIFVTQITDDGEFFVFDTDPVADTHMELGSFSDWTQSGIDSPMQPVLSAGKKPAPYISLTEWGFFLTAREPIYRHDGTTAGYAGANFYMGTVLAAQANSLRTNIIITIFIFAASLSVYFLIVYKLVSAPLRKLTVNVGRLSAGEVLSQVLMSRKDEFSLLENTFVDMSKRNADMERDVKEALNKAMEANKAKSDFLSRMSHEIRTPMNAILGITEIQLENENISLDIQEAMKKIFNSGYILLGIINDILDLSKIEAGKLELSPSNYDVPKLINDAVQLIIMRYDKKPIDFNFQVDENIPLTLFGDELRINQILNNLLSNAFKYTDKGEISMSVTAEDIRQGENPQITLVFRVADTGQGMTAEQIDTLFDDYTRFNLEANRTMEGTGLGMSITKHLVNIMNGDIFVESEPGKGSVFTVRLPQRIVDSRVLGKELAENIEQFNTGKVSQTNNTPQFIREYMPYGRVLIVDDVESNLYVARGLMAPYGLSIEIAANGFEVIEKIKKGATYDIIFMDHFMPKMDGMETTKILREMGYTHPIIALTANALIGQADMFLKNGFDGFISKPIDIRLLNSSLNKFIRDKYPAELIEIARQQAAKINPKASADGSVQPSSDSELSAIFTRDAEKAVASINSILSEGFNKKDDFTRYIIDTHSIKSALANIGETGLSNAAFKLELAGRSENIPAIMAETPAFLEQLKVVINSNKPNANNAVAKEDSEDLAAYLAEKLHVIRIYCVKNDEINANKALSELRQKKWPNITKDLLDTIAEDLLYKNFEEAVKLIEDYESIMNLRK